VSEALRIPVTEAQAYIQQQSACNVDETRWRQRCQPKTGWLWVAVTQLVTVFQVALSWGRDVAQELLGKDYAGVVGSDRAGCFEISSVCYVSFDIGTNLKLQVEYLLVRWARTRDDPTQRAVLDAELPHIQERVRHWLSVGVDCSDSPPPTPVPTCSPSNPLSGLLPLLVALNRPIMPLSVPCLTP
jgi:transposase